ncbi:MAG: iron-containing alcohol dehydrogenase [Candidatus Bathyarchaeia archaeon]
MSELGRGSLISPRIIFGVGSIDEIGGLTSELGKKVMIITDSALERAGILAKVMDRLKGLEAVAHVIEPREPLMEDAEAIAAKAKASGCEAIIGIGGGSVLDLAKVASMAPANPGPMGGYLGKDKLAGKGLPLIAIPTTSGTGSEVSQAIVLSTRDGVKAAIWDHRVMPDVAIVDPTLTISMPPKVTASSGVDALSHSVEALMSKLANPITDCLAIESIRIVFRSLPRAFAQGDDLGARSDMSMAALMAGLAFSNSSLAAGHAIAYTYSHKYGMPHGAACGLALPYAMAYNMPVIAEKLARAAGAVGEGLGDPFEMGKRFVARTMELIRMVKLPLSLREVGAREEDIAAFAKDLLEKYSRLLPNNPRRITQEDALEILRRAWEGKPFP